MSGFDLELLPCEPVHLCNYANCYVLRVCRAVASTSCHAHKQARVQLCSVTAGSICQQGGAIEAPRHCFTCVQRRRHKGDGPKHGSLSFTKHWKAAQGSSHWHLRKATGNSRKKALGTQESSHWELTKQPGTVIITYLKPRMAPNILPSDCTAARATTVF